MKIRKFSSWGCITAWKSGVRRNGDGTSPGPKTGTSKIWPRFKIFSSVIGRPLRRVSRLRQPPISIRSISFRPTAQQPSRTRDNPLLSSGAAIGGNAVPPLTSPKPAMRVTHDSIELTLPVPPSVNHQYATVHGRRLLSAKGRAYKTLVGQQILVALAQSP